MRHELSSLVPQPGRIDFTGASLERVRTFNIGNTRREVSHNTGIASGSPKQEAATREKAIRIGERSYTDHRGHRMEHKEGTGWVDRGPVEGIAPLTNPPSRRGAIARTVDHSPGRGSIAQAVEKVIHRSK